MKKIIPAVGLALVAIAGTATVAQGRSHSGKATAEVCVLLPDTKSSVRWEQFDRPDIGAALKKAGVTYVINNAQGDAQKQRSQADECLANGAKVLILDPARHRLRHRDREGGRGQGREVDRLRPPGGRR